MVDFLSGENFMKFASAENPDFESPRLSSPSNGSPVKPRLVVRKEEHGIVIKFEENNAEAIRLYGKRSYEETFSLLGDISNSHYVDNRPNLHNAPELREYMAYYLKNGQQVGLASDVVLIIKK